MIEAGLLLQTEEADCLKDAQCPNGINVSSIFGGLKGDRHVRLRTQIIDLVWLNVADQPSEVRGVSQVAVVQLEAGIGGVRVLVEVINSLGIQRRRTPLDPVNLIALIEQELRKVGPILASYAGYQCFFHSYVCLYFDLSLRLLACSIPNSLWPKQSRNIFLTTLPVILIFC